MKNIHILMVLTLLLIVPFTSAQIATEKDIKLAGVTADKPFYFIDVTLDRLVELINPQTKIVHAQERLAESRVSLNQSNIRASKMSLSQFNLTYSRMNETERIEISNDKRLFDNLGKKISTIAKNGSMTEEDRIVIRDLIEQHNVEVYGRRVYAFNG